MENLLLEQTPQSPKVELNCTGEMLITGVSTISDARKFYGLITDWLADLKNIAPKQINFSFEISYVNTPSSLMFVEILRKVNSLKSKDTEVRIIWRYEEDDEDILSFGEEIETATNSKFEYIIVN